MTKPSNYISRDLYQEVTTRILASMENAKRWQKPWRPGFGSDGAQLARPVNVTSGKGYRGINVALLWSAGRSSNVWGTYKAWQDKGANVRKGEKGTQIIFWKQLSKTNAEGEDESFMMARGYVVFNAAQVDGYVAPALPDAIVDDAARLANVDAFVASTGAVVKHGGDRAYFTPGGDYIQMPPLASFTGSDTSSPLEAYYGTLCHEMTHWSGAKSRLDREFGRRFGDAAYAFEELVAEMGAAFLCADLAVCSETRPDHAAYLNSWIEVLKNDKRAIFTAASAAEKACGYLSALAAQATTGALKPPLAVSADLHGLGNEEVEEDAALAQAA